MDTIEITIVNWDKYNPKRDQSTYSWLRLNNDFYLSSDLFGLTCEQKMVWIVLLCQASKANKATLNVNVDYIAHHLSIKANAVLQAIEIIIARQLATAGDRARPQTTPTNVTNERTNDTKPLSASADSRGRKEVGEKWNSEIRDCPQFRGWPKSRDDAAKRFLEHHTIQDWLEVIKKINESDFLSGKGNKFRATIDWALKPANVAKILEGNYENRSGGDSDEIPKNSFEDASRKILEGIKKFSSHESDKLRVFLGEELFRRVCKIPGGIAGVRSAPSGPFVVKNLAGSLREVKL